MPRNAGCAGNTARESRCRQRMNATSIGSEGIPEAERVMKVADGPEAFADEVVKMYQDPAECRRMCEETQKYIREDFSVEAAWKVIEGDFTPEKKR